MRKTYTRFWFMGAYCYSLNIGTNEVHIARPHGSKGPVKKQGFRIEKYEDGKLACWTYQGSLLGAKEVGRKFLGIE